MGKGLAALRLQPHASSPSSMVLAPHFPICGSVYCRIEQSRYSSEIDRGRPPAEESTPTPDSRLPTSTSNMTCAVVSFASPFPAPASACRRKKL